MIFSGKITQEEDFVFKKNKPEPTDYPKILFKDKHKKYHTESIFNHIQG